MAHRIAEAPMLPAEEPYLQEFTRVAPGLPGYELEWMRRLRRAALERFVELGFPTTRDANWRFTDVKPLVSIPFQRATNTSRDGVTTNQMVEAAFGAQTAYRLVFVNGQYASELSVGAHGSALVGNLASVLESRPSLVESHLARYVDIQRQAFPAFNTAFFSDGAFIRLPQGTHLEQPIHLLFVSTGHAGGQGGIMASRPVSHPRVLIMAERETKAAIIETYLGIGSGAYFTNAVTEIVVGENAWVDHYKLQRESPAAFHIATLQVAQDRASTFVTHSISLGGSLVRNDIHVGLEAEGAECTLNGLYLAAGRQHVDHHTLIDHAQPHCTSRELYKGVLEGEARAVFDGSIIVRPNAQKTDAMQTNKNLLLSQEAIVHTKPELKIFANDVKCKHGATIGQLSSDALFYLRSRGIPSEAARRLLIAAFVSEMVNRIQVESLRNGLAEWLDRQAVL